MMKANMNEMPGAGKPHVRFACAAVAAVVMAGLAPKTLAGVPSGNLPLLTDGLVVHLDASDTSTMTINETNRVVEWRSKVGSIKFTQGASQADDRLPYYQSTVSYPTTAQVPGVVFGFETGYDGYSNIRADNSHIHYTYLKGNATVTSKEIFFVMICLNCSAQGNAAAYDGYILQTGQGSDYLRYAGNSWGGNTMFSGSGSTEFYCGKTGLAWINGTLIYRDPDVVGTCGSAYGWAKPSSYGFGKSVSVTDSVGNSTRTHTGTPVLGNSGDYCGVFVACELAIYNRVLTDDERTYVQQALTDKWKNKVACVAWTGAAGDGKWSTAANWSGNAVPTASDTVAIGSANVTVDADAACSYLASIASTITVAEGVRFESSLDSIFDSTITGAGTIKLADTTATTSLSAGLTLGSALTLQAGYGSTLNLNGKSVTLGSLTGGRPVTNAAATTATLTLGAAQDGVLDCALQGDVKLVKEGAATELAVSAAQANTNDTELKGGTVTAVKKLVVDAMPGCVLHVDASRRDTMTVDANGYVTAWKSTVDPGDVFYLATTNEIMSVSARSGFHLPVYRATAVNGLLPAVRFGYLADDTLSGNATMKLGTSKEVGDYNRTHRTVFIVDRPRISGDNTVVPYGKYFRGQGGTAAGYPYPILKYWSNGNTSYDAVSPWAGGAAMIYRNGQEVPVQSGGTYLKYFYFAASMYEPRSMIPHVLCVAIPESAQSSADTFRPVLGGLGFCSYNDNGGCAGTAFEGDICELIVFDRYLPDDERRTIETYLIDKWIEKANFTPPPEWPAERKFDNAFSTASKLVVKQDTTLAPIGKQALGAITVDAQGGTTVPCLTTVGEIVVTNTALAVVNSENVKARGAILSSDTAVTGPFESVTGLTTKQKLKYKAKEVIFRILKGLNVIIR